MKRLRLTELEKRQLITASYDFIRNYQKQEGIDNAAIRANISALEKLLSNLYYLEFRQDMLE